MKLSLIRDIEVCFFYSFEKYILMIINVGVLTLFYFFKDNTFSIYNQSGCVLIGFDVILMLGKIIININYEWLRTLLNLLGVNIITLP